MVSLPVLAFPNFSKPFVVETDASEAIIGAILLQESHSITYFSKKLNPTMKKYQHMLGSYLQLRKLLKK